jgi:putative heme-binding domain-containing protein
MSSTTRLVGCFFEHRATTGIEMKQLLCSLSGVVVVLMAVVAVEFAHGDESDVTKDRDSFEASATPAEQIRVPDGFHVELLRTIPKEEEGSWVNLCVDPKGRLITSDQYGGLYRVTLLPNGAPEKVRIEKIPADVGMAQGLLWAFDSLYVVVNGSREKSGLYRVRDTDGDDVLDSVELLRHLDGDGEHGPHAVIPTADGKSLYIVCGNNTRATAVADSRVPVIWDEDRLLPRIYGVGFMRGVAPPAGAIYQVSPDGKQWERVSCGYRNPFDIALNADGELFTYDADMEWDIGAPWYRPTRVCHVVSGSDWGWRNGSAKWPVYFADTVPPVVDIGLGSPTGITFGYGAKFPAKYQNALFLCDWTYGKMYAVHLEPQGGSYGGTAEEFMSATPLPLTDAVINPHDGAMYFLIGGRKTQSGLYRLTYRGGESTAPADATTPDTEERKIRRELEALHVGDHPDAVQKAWPYLGHPDRFVRHAARTAIEHRPRKEWQERALAEKNPQASLTAILALVRKVPRKYEPVGPNLDTPPPTYPADGTLRHRLQPAVLAALDRLDWSKLTEEQRLELLRAYELALFRLGPPDEAARSKLITRLDRVYPTGDRRMDSMLTELLCYMQAPSAAEKGMQLLGTAATQEEQIDLVRSLQFLRTGWTTDLHRDLFKWFVRAQDIRGGNNFPTFIKELRAQCLSNTSDGDRAELAELINSKPSASSTTAAEPRPFVKEWKMEELIPLMQTKLTGRDFARGREMFATAKCFACHHFSGEGGSAGPDLTGLAGRFSPRDILESVLEPNKVISDQYAGSVIVTTTGKTVVGRITNYNGDDIYVNTNMEDPNATETVKRGEVESMERSDVSMMPEGLLNTLDEDEVLDLMAFLLSRGDAKNAMFSQEARARKAGTADAGKSAARGGGN